MLSRCGVGAPPCHQDAMSVSSGCSVSVIGVQHQCHQGVVSVVLGCGVSVIRVRCRCCQDTVSVLSGHSVGVSISVSVVGMWCQHRHHQDVVLVSKL